jgi:hypothetical protein
MESMKEDGTMHRILHYIVMANRLRAPLPVEKLVQKVAVNWNKGVEQPPPTVEGDRETDKLPLQPLKSGASGGQDSCN